MSQPFEQITKIKKSNVTVFDSSFSL